MIARVSSFRNIFVIVYLVLVTFLVFKTKVSTYGVNDDVILQSWMSGSYTGIPEPMIRGSATPRILFGYLMAFLFQIFPSLNWFSWIILTLVLMSWFFIGKIAVDSKNIFNLIFFIVISFIHLNWFIPSPTYTACAVIFSVSILITLLKKNNLSNQTIVILGLLYSLAYLIRPESFLFGSIIIIPSIIYFLITDSKKTKKIVIFIISFLVVACADYLIEKNYYQNRIDWQNYRILEESRYKIQANEAEIKLLKDPTKYGWTKAEAKLFEQYWTVDKLEFNSNKYLNLISTINNEKPPFNLRDFILNGHNKLIESDINWEWFDLAKLIPLSFLLFLFLSWPKPKLLISLSTVSALLIYFVMLYVAIFLRQPERVQVSAIFLGILIPFSIFNIHDLDANKYLKLFPEKVIMLILLILILNFSIRQINYLDKKYAGANNVFWIKEKEFLNSFPSDSIFVGNASQFRDNWQNPYFLERNEIENRIFSLGWHNFSPHWIKRAENLGLNSNDILSSIIQKQNVYVISDESTFQYLLTYLKEKKYSFSSVTKLNFIEFGGNDYTVWKFNS